MERGYLPIQIILIFLTFGLGLIQTSSSIARTSEMVALAPEKNKSVIISLCMSLQWGEQLFPAWSAANSLSMAS